MPLSTGRICPPLSILLPGWNESQSISNCIASLKQQTYKNFNVYMILGGDDQAPIDQAKNTNWDQLVVLDQVEPNKMKAYNVALDQRGLGDILVFSDMDCEFPANFLEQYRNAFADQKKNIITGRVCPDPEANSFVDRYHRHFEEKIAPTSKKKIKAIVGANFAVRKRFFLKAYHRFDESIAIGTDHAIARRFNEIGEAIYFEPGIKVYTPFFSDGLIRYMKQQSRWVRIRIIGNIGSNKKAFKRGLEALLIPWFMTVIIPSALILLKILWIRALPPLWWATFFSWALLLVLSWSKRYAIFRMGKGNRFRDFMGACAMLGIHFGIQMLASVQMISKKHKYRW